MFPVICAISGVLRRERYDRTHSKRQSRKKSTEVSVWYYTSWISSSKNCIQWEAERQLLPLYTNNLTLRVPQLPCAIFSRWNYVNECKKFERFITFDISMTIYNDSSASVKSRTDKRPGSVRRKSSLISHNDIWYCLPFSWPPLLEVEHSHAL